MIANRLLAKLSEQGVKLWAENSQLHIRAPKGVLTTELRESLTMHKAELLLFLCQRQIANSDTKFSPNSNIRRGSLPLSFQQEHLWVTSQISPESPSHNIVQAVRLQGQLDLASLERSLNEILRRHEALRTCFVLVEGKPFQVIGSHECVLPLIDCQDLTKDEQKSAIEQIADRSSRQPFDIYRVPLLRFKILRFSQTDHVLFLVFHHLVIDVLSVGLFLRELLQLYHALVTSNSSPLRDLLWQYGDFALWQRKWLQNEILDSQLAYWKKQQNAIPPRLELPVPQLPVPRPQPSLKNFQGVHHFFELSTSLGTALKKLSSERGVTLFTVCLTAFKVLLYRYSRQKVIVVGSPTSGRILPQLESLIGFFAYPLLLCTDLSDNPTFHELLKRVWEVTLAAYSYQIIPGEVAEVMRSNPSKRHSPMYRVLFSFLGKQQSSIKIPGLSFMHLVDTTRAPADVDLFLTMFEVENKIHGVLKFNAELFTAETITALKDSYCLILSQCVSSPETRLTELQLSRQLEKSS